MNSAPRHGVALGASVAVHLGVAVWAFVGSIVCTLDIPDIEIELVEVELLDPDQIQGDDGPGVDEPAPIPEPVVAPPEPTPEPPTEGKGEPKPEGKDTEATNADTEATPLEPRRTLGHKRSQVDKLGPATATFHFMLVPKKIRRLDHAQKAMDVMAAFPDFEYLVDGGGFDPLRDFDHMVISTPNLTDPRQTFLVVDYTMSRDDVRRTIERAAAAHDERLEWIDEGGALRANPVPIDPEAEDWDPRWFVLPEANKIAAYIREEYVPALLRDEEEIGEEKTSANYVANLSKLKRFAARIPSAGLQAVGSDLLSGIRRIKNLPFAVPDALELTIQAAAEPEVLLRATFPTAAEATLTAKYLREDLRAIVEGNVLLRFQVMWLFDTLEIVDEGKEVRIWGQFDRGQIDLLLDLAVSGVAKVQRKTPEEIEASRARRLENWEKREHGKLPPAALDEQEREREAKVEAVPALEASQGRAPH